MIFPVFYILNTCGLSEKNVKQSYFYFFSCFLFFIKAKKYVCLYYRLTRI